ncbi:hypothetical protein P5V15_014255 [Pogonomyrmex californicus]
MVLQKGNWIDNHSGKKILFWNLKPRIPDRNRNNGHSKVKRKKRHDFHNTQGLYRAGALREVMETYRISVLTIQEIRKGNGIFDTKSHTILHSSGNEDSKSGVAFIVKKNESKHRLQTNKQETMLYKTRFCNLFTINVHAETKEKDDITKERMYQAMSYTRTIHCHLTI